MTLWGVSRLDPSLALEDDSRGESDSRGEDDSTGRQHDKVGSVRIMVDYVIARWYIRDSSATLRSVRNDNTPILGYCA
jgi:hypothetical protein